MDENLHIRTSTGVDLEFELAGLGDRILAYLLDTLILVAYSLVVGIIVLRNVDFSTPGFVFIYILLFLPVLLYHFLCETFLNGQSIGKQARRIQVARLDGKQATIGNYALRSLLRPLEITFVSGSFAIVSIISTRFGQRLGDLAAGTVVVRVKKTEDLRSSLFREVDDEVAIRYPEVSQLNNAEAETIGLILTELQKSRNAISVMRIAHDARMRLCERFSIESNEEDTAFLSRLLDDYNRYHVRS